jgi:hypothetical protein
MSKCYKTSNNQYFNSPSRMADGRHFTDYRPNCLLNNNLKHQTETLNSYDYKLYLQRNAEKIMDLNRKHSYILNGEHECCSKNKDVPEKHIQTCDLNTCSVTINNSNGIGMGRDFKSEGHLIMGLNDEISELKPNKCFN